MSETALFIVGAIVFAITVYGTVMAGGTLFTRIHIEQNPHLRDEVDEDGAKKRFPRGEF